MATAATYHSAFAFLTSVAVFAFAGVTFWIASSAWTVLAGVFMCLIGPRIYRLGNARGPLTPADMLSDYYDSKVIGIITAIVMALFIIAYIVVQAIIPTKRKYINKYGAISGLVVGSILAALLAPQIGGKIGIPALERPAVAGLVAVIINVIIAILVSLVTKPSENEIKVKEEYDKVLTEV